MATINVTRAGEGEHWLVVTDDTSGKLLVIEMRVPPGGGPPVHHRHAYSEVFLLQEGEFEVSTLDEDSKSCHTGDTMNGTRRSTNSRIGHVHLRVADLARATAFYRDVLGFDVTAYGPDLGVPGAAFLSMDGYHHHIGLNTWESQGGAPPPQGHTGLYHFAIIYPDRRELGEAVERVLDHGYAIDDAEDHGLTVSVYLRDPDGNGIELYYDRPRAEWFDPEGNPILKAEPFDPRDLTSASAVSRSAIR